MTTPTPSPTGPGTLTDAIYRASLDPARGALIDQHYSWLTNSNATAYNPALAKQLLTAAQLSGLPIDTEIMLWGWSAPMTMLIRQNNGYAWVPPNGTPNINVGPGLPPPVGEVSNYPSSMPPGWIKVSTAAADYPAYVPPAAPVVPITWTPDLTNMLSWTEAPSLSNGVLTPGKTQYYFGIVAGQSPSIGTPCNFDGSAFVCAYYPNPEPMGGMVKMWLLTGAATAGS